MPVQFQREDLAGYRVGADTVNNAYNQGQQSARELVRQNFEQKNANMNRLIEAQKGIEAANQASALFRNGINPQTGQPLGPMSPELYDQLGAQIEANQNRWSQIADASSEQLPRVTTTQMTTDANGKWIPVMEDIMTPRLDPVTNKPIIGPDGKPIMDKTGKQRAVTTSRISSGIINKEDYMVNGMYPDTGSYQLGGGNGLHMNLGRTLNTNTSQPAQQPTNQTTNVAQPNQAVQTNTPYQSAINNNLPYPYQTNFSPKGR